MCKLVVCVRGRGFLVGGGEWIVGVCVVDPSRFPNSCSVVPTV